MTKRFTSQALVWFMAAACGLCGAARVRAAQVVALGTDYLTTAPGTQFNVPGIGLIQFKGKPLTGLGTTDTVVERQEDADLAPGQATIPIQVTELSLESTAPVTINGLSCNVSVTLNAANLAQDVGSMTIVASPATFDSTFTLFYILTFTTAAGQTCRPPITGNCQFGQNGASWNTAPLPSAFLVTGPDNCTPTTPPTSGHCLGTKDQKANEHKPLAKGAVDFYVAGTALHMTGGGQHVVYAACQSASSCSQSQ
jgi:hypothetical protein